MERLCPLPLQVGLHPEMAPEVHFAGLMHLRNWKWTSLSAYHWRWYWNDRSGASISLDKRRWDLSPGKIMLLPPGLPCSANTVREVQHLFIHFTLPWSYRPAHLQPLTRAIAPLETKTICQFQDAASISSTPAGTWEISRLSHLLIQLALPLIPAGDLKKPDSDPRIEKAIQLCRRALPRPASNTELARSVGLSAGAFIRLFTRITGETPHQYQLRRRLENACHLMHNPKLTLEEIAEQTGFYDRFHFSRAFRRQMKVTPAAFRRQNVHAR